MPPHDFKPPFVGRPSAITTDEERYKGHPLEGGNGWAKEQKYVLETLREVKESVGKLGAQIIQLQLEQRALVSKIQLVGVVGSLIVSAIVSALMKWILK